MSKSLCIEICDSLRMHEYWVFYTKKSLSLDEQYGVSQIKIGMDFHEPVSVMDGRNAVAIKSDKDYSSVKYIELIYS